VVFEGGPDIIYVRRPYIHRKMYTRYEKPAINSGVSEMGFVTIWDRSTEPSTQLVGPPLRSLKNGQNLMCPRRKRSNSRSEHQRHTLQRQERMGTRARASFSTSI